MAAAATGTSQGVVAQLAKERLELQSGLCSLQVEEASRKRNRLVETWREVCKPRKQGAIAAQPPGARVDFAPLFDKWLAARGLTDALERVEDHHGWLVYKYKSAPIVEAQDGWDTAFHGTWWYPVWLILHSGILLESNDLAAGHDFWEPGVYCSPNMDTARWYSRPQILFGDGCFHRVLFELRVDPEQRKRERKRGGVQWVFPSKAVSIYAMWVQVNSPPVNGEERINDWDPDLEALPEGFEQPPVIVNERKGPWPNIKDEGWNKSEVPAYLAACNYNWENPWPTSKTKPSSAEVSPGTLQPSCYARNRDIKPPDGWGPYGIPANGGGPSKAWGKANEDWPWASDWSGGWGVPPAAMWEWAWEAWGDAAMSCPAFWDDPAMWDPWACWGIGPCEGGKGGSWGPAKAAPARGKGVRVPPPSRTSTGKELDGVSNKIPAADSCVTDPSGDAGGDAWKGVVAELMAMEPSSS